MKYEYLIFNLVVILGPLMLSFDKKVQYFRNWQRVLIATAIAAVPFILWDSLVAGRHWFFNPEYTLGFHLLGLPIEEWMFFFSVPFSCLFVWEVIVFYWPKMEKESLRPPSFLIAVLFLFLSAIFSFYGKEYTSLASLATGSVILLDRLLRTHLLQRKGFYVFLGIVVLSILVFNFYLTSRPVVTYDSLFQLDIRIFTIPIEDFFFGISHLGLCLVLYQAFEPKSTKLPKT